MLTDGADLADGTETLREDLTALDALEGAVTRIVRVTVGESSGRDGATYVVRLGETLSDLLSSVGRVDRIAVLASDLGPVITVVVLELVERADRPTSTTPGCRTGRATVLSGVDETEGDRVDCASIELDLVTGLLACAWEETDSLALTRDIPVDGVVVLELLNEDNVDSPRVGFVRNDCGVARSAEVSAPER
ncbi:MAG: hypothetical protein ABIH23_00355 [bacterium]